MKGIDRAEEHDPQQLGALLKRCRARLGPGCASLGPYLRLPVRVGKVVTQEEVAEAAGISRQWYAMMESNRPLRVSPTVLGRIADVLVMDSTERAALFRLAVPELRSTSLMHGTTAMLDAFGSLRRLTRRLWAATTEAETLTIVRDHAMTELKPDVTATCIRLEEGRWDYAATRDDHARREQFHALLRDRGGPVMIDELYCYTLMGEPGDLAIRSELDARFPKRAARLRPALDAFGRGEVSVAMSNIRPHQNFVARLVAFHRRAHVLSDIERAQLSTLADLASLALSGRA